MLKRIPLDQGLNKSLKLLSGLSEITETIPHLRCGGWLNFELSKEEKHLGWSIKTIYKKQSRCMLKRIPLDQGLNKSLKLLRGLTAAYKGMVRPILEYGSSVWDPHPDKLKKELEKVQNRAARFVTRNYDYETGSMTGILGQLKWESLKKRRKDNRLILLYKGLKGKAKIPTDDLIPKTRHGRNQHSLAFQIPSASKDVYMYSFFPQTIRDWNNLPESLISSSELSDDCVSKFTSLVRARD